VFAKACHWFLPRGKWIQSIPSHTIFLRPILLLSSCFCIGVQSGIFLASFWARIFVTFFTHMHDMAASSQILGEEYWSELCMLHRKSINRLDVAPNFRIEVSSILLVHRNFGTGGTETFLLLNPKLCTQSFDFNILCFVFSICVGWCRVQSVLNPRIICSENFWETVV
jgi:hypothetical protein